MGINLRVGQIQSKLIEEYGEKIHRIFDSVKNGSASGCEMTG